jgi:hypothetical protein
MIRNTILTALVAGLVAATATAQDKRVEISGSAGWTFSDGVSGPAVVVPKVGTYTRIDPLNAFSWGARVGFLLGDNNEIGFLFNQQSTDLDLGGTSSLKIADVSIRNYHGYFAYNFLAHDSIARPYLLLGFGATQYAPSAVAVSGVTRSVSGNTKFSGTGAVGIKIFPEGRNFGLRLEGRWTPTYIKSDATGFWCDPYWGCYVTSNAQYANQFEWSGGIMLRF